MSLAETRAKIKAGIWQAVARSGVDLSALSQEDVDKLVGAITEGVLKEVDDLLGETSGTPAFAAKADPDDGADDDVEKVLWEGRPYLSISVQYQITNERVRIIEGALMKERRDIELIRIKDVDHTQSLTERAFSIGDIYIRSADASDPEIVLSNVSNPVEVHEILRRAVLNARKKHKFSLREEL
jgi:hypothetical protein